MSSGALYLIPKRLLSIFYPFNLRMSQEENTHTKKTQKAENSFQYCAWYPVFFKFKMSKTDFVFSFSSICFDLQTLGKGKGTRHTGSLVIFLPSGPPGNRLG